MKTVVMAGRRRWVIGGAIGLSRDYFFVGGQPIEVSDEDARVLLALTDGHEFALVGTPEGDVEVAAGIGRAATAAVWQAPGKCCDDDEGEGGAEDAEADTGADVSDLTPAATTRPDTTRPDTTKPAAGRFEAPRPLGKR